MNKQAQERSTLETRLKQIRTRGKGKPCFDEKLRQEVLRQVERLQEQGMQMKQACKQLGVSSTTVYGWKARAKISGLGEVLRPVTVEPTKEMEKAKASKVRVVLPSGICVEGEEILEVVSCVKELLAW